MGVFKSSKVINGNPALIETAAQNVKTAFAAEGYEFSKTSLANGCEVYLTKGGIFKAVLGLKTSLNISITECGPNQIQVQAGVGIFGQQAIPTAIMLFVFWPVLLTQIWGMVVQSGLDDKAIKIIEGTFQNGSAGNVSAAGAFCRSCGAAISFGQKFCNQCGNRLA